MHPIIHTLITSQRSLLLLGVVAVLLLIRAVARRRRNPRGLPLPPGPKGLPLIGNLFHLPQYDDSPWEGYDALCRQYGDLVYLDVLGQGMLILGTSQRVSDLLDKRAAIYSDRPKIAVNDLMNMNWMMGGMAYGSIWRNNRRTFHQHLNHNVTANYHPIMNEERNELLRQMTSRPEDFLQHARTYFGRSAMRSAYGFDDTEQAEWHISNADQIIEAIGHANTPGRFMVNTFPILRYIPSWVPGAGFQKYFQEQAVKNQRTVEGPFEEARMNMVRDKRSPHHSLAAALIEKLPDLNDPAYPELKGIAMNVCANVYVAGADSSVASAEALILALASNPQVQKKAQDELDRVVGANRLPLVSDRPALPYVHAIVKEVSRWHTILPMGLPHTTSEDDEYDGYYIPKGTYVLPSVWAMMHSASTFERPFDFIPERYLKDGKVDDVEIALFGFGRRICPGRHLSNDALFLFAASLLAVYDIGPSRDEAGRPIPLKYEMTSGLVAKPAPFRCDFTLRKGKVDVVEQEL